MCRFEQRSETSKDTIEVFGEVVRKRGRPHMKKGRNQQLRTPSK